MIKFIKPFSQFSYILSFDLAKRVSGYTLYDIINDKVLLAGVVDTTKTKDECIWNYFYSQIMMIVEKCISLIGDQNRDYLFITKEKLPNQNGKFSTIDTLQGLAQTHAVFDLAIIHADIQTYDFEGVHSTSVKAYFKSVTDCEKPQKEDIAKYIKQTYSDFDFSGYPLDVTDSLGVTLTLVNRKWNNDILEKIRELKKEQKSAKTKAKITKLAEEIKFLESLKK